MNTIKKIKRFLLLLCLMTMGTAKVEALEWPTTGYYPRGTITVDNLQFALVDYFEGHNVTAVTARYAWLIDITGEEETVVVPDMITDSYGMKYSVYGVGDAITNNNVKTLIFKGDIDFHFTTLRWYDSFLMTSVDSKTFHGSIVSSSLQSIVFQGNFYYYVFGVWTPALYCENLTNLYFKKDVPYLEDTWSRYVTAPAGNITLHVYDQTEEQMAALRNNDIWKTFKEIVNLTNWHNATLTSNSDELVEVWKTNGNTQLEYSLSSGGEKTMRLHEDYNYQVRIYYNSSQGRQPILQRNGITVNTIESDDGSYCYYDEPTPKNVNSYDVFYIEVRRFKLSNFGYGEVKLTGKVDGEEVTRMADGATEAYYSFDNTEMVKVEITPDEGYKVRQTIMWGYMPLPFTLNPTTGVATQYYSYANKANTEESLKIYYQKATVPEGTQYNVHLSVEGAEGSCYAIFGDGDYSWLDEDVDDNDLPWQVDPGESYDLVGAYEDGQYVEFWAITDFNEGDGIVNSVKVYANGALVDDFEPTEEWGDHYTIPLDGGDMDIRIVFESNARQLTGNNGEGGTLAIFKEGSSEALATYASNRTIWHKLPKTGTYYAVITPNDERDVMAVLRDGTLLSSLETFRQSDGTYRIPLENFGNGDSRYQLSIVYGSAVESRMAITVSGSGTVECVVLKNDGTSSYTRVESNEYKEASYNPDEVDDGAVIFVFSKPQAGQTLKVFRNGEDVTSTLIEQVNEEITTYSGGFTLNTTYMAMCPWGEIKPSSIMAVYENNATHTLLLAGEQVGKALVYWLDEDGITLDDFEANAEEPYATMWDTMDDVVSARLIVKDIPEGYTFKAYFNGVEITDFTINQSTGSHNAILDGETIKKDGTWLVYFFKEGGDNPEPTKYEVTVSSTTGGETKVYYTNPSDGDTYSAFFNNENTTQTYTIKSKTDVRFEFTPIQGCELELVVAGSKRMIGEGCDVVPQGDGSYVFTLPASDFNNGRAAVVVYYKKRNGDVNGDGDVDISDVTKLVNEILGKSQDGD